MKVVQFGLRYSPNLGDGIIAECLAHAIRAQVEGAQVILVDISGRDGFGAVTVKNRALALKLLGMLPQGLRHRIVRRRLGQLLDRVAPDWARLMRGADLAILGGGQIFADADLNFPLKIARVAEVAKAADVPVVIHAAGVQGGWSEPGRALFNRIFETDLRRIGLRDDGSMAAWAREAGGPGPAPVLARDPGLLAADCYGAAPASQRIGLCITDPAILHYHADAGVAGGGLGFYHELALAITSRGHKVTLFCNGAVEDQAALERVIADPGMAAMVLAGTVSIADVPRRPADLARLIGGFQGVVAHRLHACILAWSYRVPVVGLGWDRKVESFFASVGADRAFAGGGADAAEIADRLQAALAAGVDPARHAKVLEETRAGIAAALQSARRRVKR
jgi:polysaccharide pyruvyl transferase WcaK-like protein